MLTLRACSGFPRATGIERMSDTILDSTLPTLAECPESAGPCDVRVPKLNKAQTPRKTKVDPLRVACELLADAIVGLKEESMRFCGS
jgi:hypothetical protein